MTFLWLKKRLPNRLRKRKRVSRLVRSSSIEYRDYERLGESSLKKLAEAATQESWVSKILLIFWGAGPVTGAALFIAYYLINDRIPPLNLIFYFGLFTGLYGLVMLFTNFVINVRSEHRQSRAQRILLKTVARVPDFILSVRNEFLASLDEKDRLVQGALYLLQDPDSTPESIETALEDLTGSRELSQRFRRVESYRKKGLSFHAKEEAQRIREKFGETLELQKKEAPEVSQYLELRLDGHVPSKRIGKKRKEGFLTNISYAKDLENPDLMELKDTEELLKLVAELLTGRSFFMAKWKVSGSSSIALAARKREQAARAYNRFKKEKKELVSYLLISLRKSKLYPELSFDEDTDFTTSNLEKLKSALSSIKERNQKQYSQEQKTSLSRKEIKEILQAADELYEISKDLKKAKTELRKARTKFQNLRKQRGRDFPLLFYKNKPTYGPGVFLQYSFIKLTETQRLALAKKLNDTLQSLSPTEDFSLIVESHREHEAQRRLSPKDIKELTLEIFDDIEEFIDLSTPSVREAIECSNSFNLGLFETGLSMRAKYGWVLALAEEIEEQPSVVVLKTLERLMHYFRANLSEQGLQFFQKEWGLSRELLKERLVHNRPRRLRKKKAKLKVDHSAEPKAQSENQAHGLFAKTNNRSA
jgi:hypothetical protein